MLQVHKLLILEFPARGLEASSEPAAGARAGARTEEVELWDKKLIQSEMCPLIPFQMPAPRKKLLATPRALHLLALRPFV